MKKLLILILAVGLVTVSCNNDKGKPPMNDDRGNNNRDDDDNGNRNRDDDDNGRGWSSSDKRQWMKLCADPLKDNMGDSKANNYCECILGKMEERYSSLEKANSSGSYEDGKALGQELAMDCARELGLGQ